MKRSELYEKVREDLEQERRPHGEVRRLRREGLAGIRALLIVFFFFLTPLLIGLGLLFNSEFLMVPAIVSLDMLLAVLIWEFVAIRYDRFSRSWQITILAIAVVLLLGFNVILFSTWK